jgi:prepilin-type N-terminal cleavage/methylation domain-containing protein
MRIQIELSDSAGRRPAGGVIAVRSVSSRSLRGLTLIEVVIATAIVAVVFGSTIEAYIQSGQRVAWSGYSLAAESLAQQAIEQARSAVWDPAQISNLNQVTNLNIVAGSASYNASNQTWTAYATNILDVPYSGNNYTLATNFLTVQMIYLDGGSNCPAQFVRVDCVWPYGFRTGMQYFTNTVSTLIAPDNRDPSTF